MGGWIGNILFGGWIEVGYVREAVKDNPKFLAHSIEYKEKFRFLVKLEVIHSVAYVKTWRNWKIWKCGVGN